MKQIIILLGQSWPTYIIFFIMFFSIFEFIYNKFQFSSNKYFKFIQIISFILFILVIAILLDFINNNLNVTLYMTTDPSEDPHAKLVSTAREVLEPFADKLGNSAAVAAGAQAGAKIVSTTMQSAPIGVKGAMVVGTAAGVLGAKLGVEALAKSISGSTNNSSNSNNQSTNTEASNLPNNTTSNTSETSSMLENIDPLSNFTDFNVSDLLNLDNLFILSPNESNIFSLLFNGRPAEVVLSSILVLSIVVLLFTIILSIVLLSLSLLNSNSNLNSNNKFKFITKFIGKSYKLNIFICILLILIFDSFIIYMVYSILNNLDIFCSNYLDNLNR